MKTCILRDPKAVEPQNRKRNPLPAPLQSAAAVTTTMDAICWPAIHGEALRSCRRTKPTGTPWPAARIQPETAGASTGQSGGGKTNRKESPSEKAEAA